MIARIAGRLEEVRDGTVLIDVGGGLWYEALIPACDIERLSRRVGQDIMLHTICFLEGDPTHGASTPRLVGFASDDDRRFFRLFTTVKGIGLRKALKAMVRPVAEVATAIQNKDTKTLVALPGIGKRAAETIVAELHGKTEEFAGTTQPALEPEMSGAAAEAMAVLIQLGERRADATALIERVIAVAPELETPEEILQYAYKLKTGGR